MRTLVKHLTLSALVALIYSTVLPAQELYLAVSGESVTSPSGDNTHSYDFWLKPGENAQIALLQVFDASLGGPADLISQGKANTNTTFEVFNFDDVYQYTNNTVRKAEHNSSEPLLSFTAFNEEEFVNKWTDVFNSTLEASKSGYILRVSADQGNDINSYKIRLTDSTGEVVSGRSWKIITIDLSVAVFNTPKNKAVQLKPYLPAFSTVNKFDKPLYASGQEDAQINKIDSFGELYPLITSARLQPTKYGQPVQWGLQISGSEHALNSLTVVGNEEPLLWILEPVFADRLEKPVVTVGDNSDKKCSDFNFELSSNEVSGNLLSRAKWVQNERVLATGQSQIVPVEGSGDVSLQVLIPSENGYFPEYWVYSHPVFVNSPPVARIDVPKNILSPGETVTISAAGSYDIEGNPLTFTWFVNGVPKGNDPQITFSDSLSGNNTVTVQISDGGPSVNCSVSQKITQVRVNTRPFAEIDFPAEIGTDTAVTAKVLNVQDADGDSLFFSWDGPGIQGTKAGPQIQLSRQEPGEYNLALTVNDSTHTTNARYTTSTTYKVNAPPVVSADIPVRVANGHSVTFSIANAADPDGDSLSYTWLIDNEATGFSEEFTYVREKPAPFTVTLKVSDGKGLSNSVQQIQQKVTVNSAPVAIITAPGTTNTTTVEFSGEKSNDAETSITGYEWDFGDGTTAKGANVQHTFPSPGSYNVTLRVDDGEGLANSIGETTYFLVIEKQTEIDFSLPAVVGTNELFALDGTKISYPGKLKPGFQWLLNGEPVNSDSIADISISEPGLHTVTLRLTDPSVPGTIVSESSKNIRVNYTPVPKWLSSRQLIAPGDSITFSAETSYDPDGEITGYTWLFSDGEQFTGPRIRKSFEETGTQSFTLTVSDGEETANSDSSVTGSIQVNTQPFLVTDKSIFSNDLSIQLDASESYDLDGDPLRFTWILPDGSRRNESSFTWQAPEAGIHIIGIAIDDLHGLSNSLSQETIQIEINEPVQAVVDSLITSCTGQSVLFNSSGSFDPNGDQFTATWFFGDGSSSMESNPTHRYSKPGTYKATVKLHDGISKDTTIATIPVRIEGSPIANLNIADTTICVNSKIILDGRKSSDPSGSLPSMNWDLGDGENKTGGLIDHVYTEPGNYTVSLTVEGSGSGQCSNVAQAFADIEVIEGPKASFSLPEWTSPGKIIKLDGSASTAEDEFSRVRWYIENETTSDTLSDLKTEYTFDEPGEYFVTLFLETDAKINCNNVSLTRVIKVNAEPQIVWDFPEFIAYGSDYILNASESYDPDGFISSFRWKKDGQIFSTNSSVVLKSTTTGTHLFELTVTDNTETSNNQVTVSREIPVNAQPTAKINTPQVVYQGDTVTLSAGSNTDADGDPLQQTWLINNQSVPEPVFTASENRIYDIKLILDDGKGLSNSIDTAYAKIKPIPEPDMNPGYPSRIAKGTGFSTQELNLKQSVWFAMGNQYSRTWVAETAGDTTFTLVWKPGDRVLSSEEFNITVEPLLAFTGEVNEVPAEWNPDDPVITVEAPPVNRSPDDVLFTWTKDGQVIGYGPQIEVSVSEGENVIVVEARDLKVAKSRPAQVAIKIVTE